MTNQTNSTILIVDDTAENLSILADILQPKYRVLATTSGAACLKIAGSDPKPDLILLDVIMPGMDGYEVLFKLHQNPLTRDIPVIFLTALTTAANEESGLKLGAVDYITKPITPSLVLARVRTQIEAKHARDWMKNQNIILEAEVKKRMLENNLIQRVSIRALAHLAEMRDMETGNHILRTQGYMHRLATSLNQHPRFATLLNDRYIDLLTESAPLHDIGKVGIPDHILLKPGKHSQEEWAIMKTHAKLGSDAIEQAERDIDMHPAFFSAAKEIARWHHEKWDGSGYPDGLAKDAIPVSARLMAVADVFDALISKRAYKPAIPFDQARDMLAAERGKHFDPDIIDTFLDGFDDFVTIAKQYQDTEQVAKEYTNNIVNLNRIL
ncbi:MAG: hypothetical protein RLZZ419_1232 [Pseudomonadota bacterium]